MYVFLLSGEYCLHEKKNSDKHLLRMKCQFSVDSIAVVEDLNIMH